MSAREDIEPDYSTIVGDAAWRRERDSQQPTPPDGDDTQLGDFS